MNSPFFALISRLRWIRRWSLMRNSYEENVMEHSWEVATIAHALALIRNKHFSGQVDVNSVVVRAMYHDVSEVITADMPTPIKYYSPEIRDAYKSIEAQAGNALLQTLPPEIQEEFAPLLTEPNYELDEIVKGADSLSAFIKCRLEGISGNQEFAAAEESIRRKLQDMQLPEINYFLDHFLSDYGKNLDEITSVEKR